MMLSEEAAALAERYAALAAAIERLVEERKAVEAALVASLGEARGAFDTPSGTVRVIERPTVRFVPSRVAAALDEAGFLREVAQLTPSRLRAAMVGNHRLARAVAPFVEEASYTFVDARVHASATRATTPASVEASEPEAAGASAAGGET